MSEFHVVVVEIGEIQDHPNADRLSITNVMNAYPCVIRKGEFQPGDKAVYIPIDSFVPLKDSRFSFLSDVAGKEYQRIKAKKLRNLFSMGMLIPSDPAWIIGQNVQEELGIKKWEPEADKLSTSGLSVVCGISVPVYDLEGLRKYKGFLIEGEEIQLEEKIHGSSARFLVDTEGTLWVGSRNQFKKEDPTNMWWKMALQHNLKEKLAPYSNLVFYGEVYGNVQDLKYDANKNEVFLRFFDIFDLSTNRFLDIDDRTNLLANLELEVVPLLFRGPWSEELMSLAEGQSTIASNIREGFVVRPIKERWEQTCGRVIFKMVGQDYLLRS